jgi:CRISPR-associated protein Csx17
MIDFFCEKYHPTPLVAPWNGGSGFYPGDNTAGMDAILSTQDFRFQHYQEVIRAIRSWPEMPDDPHTVKDVVNRLQSELEKKLSEKRKKELEDLIKGIDDSAAGVLSIDDSPMSLPLEKLQQLAKDKQSGNRGNWSLLNNAAKKAMTECKNMSRSSGKEQILAVCRNRLPDDVVDWLDATFALGAQGEAFYSPILGTGANEGRLEFTNKFMQRITSLLLYKEPGERKQLLGGALFGNVVSGMEEAPIGQFDPGRAGGFNQGMGVETKDFSINPWNFILTLEGTLVLASAIARRSPANPHLWLSTPFSVRFSPVGFTSNDYAESGRSEIWLPLWNSPSRLAEIKQLFGEGRSVLGRRAPRTGLEFSRAVGTLGVDRGISAFERYAFLERRGQSYVALPLGRFPVQNKPSLELLNDLDPILNKLDGFLRLFPSIPASYLSSRRQIDEAMFACAVDGSRHSFQRVIRALGRMEQLIAQRDRSKKPSLAAPLFGLSPLWIKACADGSPELRIAAAVASISSTGKVGSIRTYMAGVAPGVVCRWEEKDNHRFWYGNSLRERLANVLLRRQMDAGRYQVDRFPLYGHITVPPHEIMPFLYGETDDATIEELLWGFTLIDWYKGDLKEVRESLRTEPSGGVLSRTWCLLKLLHTQHTNDDGQPIRHEPRIGQLIVAGRISEACVTAIRRLKTSDLLPFNVQYEENLDPIRLLASLIVPISRRGEGQLKGLVLDTPKEVRQ